MFLIQRIFSLLQAAKEIGNFYSLVMRKSRLSTDQVGYDRHALLFPDLVSNMLLHIVNVNYTDNPWVQFQSRFGKDHSGHTS